MVSLRLVLLGLNFKKIVPIIKNQAVNLQTNVVMKSQRVYEFLVVLLLIFPSVIFSQQQMPRIEQNSPHGIIFSENFLKKPDRVSDWVSRGVRTRESLHPHDFLKLQLVEPRFMISDLPFFCRQEYKFEKTTLIPLRLRLGSLEYVNKLEGKK
jgi:hypothetical protein